MTAVEIQAVADKLAEVLGRAGESAGPVLDGLVAEYRLLCIGYVVVGVLFIGAAAACAATFLYTLHKWDDWGEDAAGPTAIISCGLGVISLAAGLAVALRHLGGALAPRVALLQQLLS